MNYLNLTNGLEFADRLPPGWQVCRIRSTDIEKADWLGLLGDLDHGLLFNLARGLTCVVWDCGAGREVSKVVSFGVPFVRATLSWLWLGNGNRGLKRPDHVHETAEDAYRLVTRATSRRAQEVKRKLLYYRRLRHQDLRHVRLVGRSEETSRDGDLDYFLSKLRAATIMGALTDV